MRDFELYDEEPTIITIGGEASDFVSVYGDYEEQYANAFGAKFAQKRAAAAVKRQAAKQQRIQAKAETKAVKQQARADRKVGRQQVRQAKQVAKQERKTAKIQARDVKKQARVGMRATAKAGRVQGRQEKRNIRLDNRMMRREMRNPVPIPTEPQYEEPFYEEPLPTDPNAGYTEDVYAPEEMATGYETNAEVEQDTTGEYGNEGYGYGEEGDYSGDANPNYSEDGYDPYLPDYVSEDGGFSDEFDDAYAQANGVESVLVRPRVGQRQRMKVGTRVDSENASFAPNRIVVKGEKKSNFNAEDDPNGLIALNSDNDYDAPEETVINLEPKSGFDGKMSNTTKSLLGIGALLAIGIYVLNKK